MELKADESLFAVMRVVVAMLVVDGKCNSKELKWLQWLMNRYQLTEIQQQTLLADFKQPQDVESFFHHIRYDDRERLVDWIKVAMHIDDTVESSEKKFYKKVLELNNNSLFLNDEPQVKWAKELLKADSRTQFWKDIGVFSEKIKRPIHPQWRLLLASWWSKL